MRRAAAVTLALLALVGGLFAWTSRAGNARGGHRAERIGASVTNRTTDTAPGARSDHSEDPEEPLDRAMVRIEGWVPLSLADGTIRFRVDGGPEAEEAIREQEWEAVAPKGSTLTIEEVRFGDRLAIATPRAVEVPEDGKVHLACHWAVPTLLRVIGENGEDLRDVEYYEAGVYDDWGPGWPDATPATSPIELKCEEGTHTYLVRAPGHAWSSITLFVGFGGERVVRLARAGALQIQISPYTHALESARTFVRVTSASTHGRDAISYWFPDEAALVKVDGLNPGVHEVVAMVGYGVVGRAEATIEPGTTTRLNLPVSDVPVAGEPVPLAGTIEVARGWFEADEVRPGLVTNSIRAWNRYERVEVEGPDERGRWSAGDVRPGSYCFRLDTIAWIQSVQVGPEGASDVLLSVPPPCDVELRLVDVRTAEPFLGEETIAWYSAAPDVADDLLDCWCAEDHGSLAVHEEPGLYRFRAPRGILHAWYAECDIEESGRRGEVKFALKPGLNQVELRVGWLLCADLALRDGAMPVPAGDVVVEALSGEESVEEVYEDRLGLRIYVTRPGRYRVTFPAIEGYEPIEPVEVEVAAGRIPRVEIALRPKGR